MKAAFIKGTQKVNAAFTTHTIEEKLVKQPMKQSFDRRGLRTPEQVLIPYTSIIFLLVF